MPIPVIDLIARVPAEVEGRVKRVRDQARSTVQEALRTECRLSMRTSDEADENRAGAQVPVEVAPGYPAILTDLTFPDDLELILLLGKHRSALRQTSTGLGGLRSLREELSRRSGFEPHVQTTDAELASVKNWADELLSLLDKHDPLKVVLGVRDDWLGVYQYQVGILIEDEFAINRATIQLYWGVIGLSAEWMGCTVEDLALVVLTHELAHAYTQLGADIEGRRWPALAFCNAERGLKEGLAQYYTDRVLTRLERRHPGAVKVYRAMLPGQPADYRTHEGWVTDFSPESVRRAMLEVRRWKEGKLSDFNRRLAEAQKQLQPKKE